MSAMDRTTASQTCALSAAHTTGFSLGDYVMSDFSDHLGESFRKIRNAETKEEMLAQQEFAEARQYYHGSGIETRKRMKKNMQALVELNKRLGEDYMRVLKVRFSCEHYDDEGTPTISLGAEQSPKLWLEAIHLWDETENISSLRPLG